MKSSILAKALVLTAVVAIALTPGCRRKAKEPITPLPAGRTGAGGIQNPGAGGPSLPGGNNPGRGNPVNPGLGVNNGVGPQGNDLTGSNPDGTGIQSAPPPANTNVGLGEGPVDRSQYNEDRAQFAANVVFFDFDSAVVKTSEKSKVTAVVDHLRANPRAAVEIEGHCDERGTEEYNRSLGERRALAVREEIAAAGIDPKRVYTISFGEDRPAVTGHDEAAWSKNRRGEFVLLTPR